jgi:Beta-ketoacyl synthase, N-terminal domain
MSTGIVVAIEGIGAWTCGAPDWPTLRGVLRGTRALDAGAPARPCADMLPAAERRRAPDGVLLAVDVARQATAMAGRAPAALPCVFASAYGEPAITDYVCATLARSPLELSPTKFHNSVLNAAAGYWTIAAGCTMASSAVTAHRASFGAGLLEAALLAVADATPVLFVALEVAATGPLADMIDARLPFGIALVLAPAARGTHIALALQAREPAPLPPPVALRALAGDNPLNAHALALLAALADARAADLSLPLSPQATLVMEISP